MAAGMWSPQDSTASHQADVSKAQNPYAPPAAESSDPELDKLRFVAPGSLANTKWDQLLLVALLAIALFGAPAAFAGIETIIYSGLALFLASIALLIRELWCRRDGRRAWTLGLVLAISGLGFVLGLIGLINVNNWGPNDAKKVGVPYVVAVFGVWLVLGSYVAWRTIPRQLETASGSGAVSSEV